MTVQGPGARVRITIEGIVRTAQPGEITLIDGTHVETRSRAATLEVLKPGFEVGDVVHDGDRHLLRIQPEDEPAHWIGADGRRTLDEETDPTTYKLIARAASRPAEDTTAEGRPQ